MQSAQPNFTYKHRNTAEAAAAAAAAAAAPEVIYCSLMEDSTTTQTHTVLTNNAVMRCTNGE